MRSHTMLGYPFKLIVELDGGPLDISDLLQQPNYHLDINKVYEAVKLEERARELAKGRCSGGILVGSFGSITRAAEHLVEQYAIDHGYYWIEHHDDRCRYGPERWLVMRGDRP